MPQNLSPPTSDLTSLYAKQGLLTTLAPLLVLVLLLMDAPGEFMGASRELPLLALLLSSLAGLLLFIAGLLLPAWPGLGRPLSILALGGFSLCVVPGIIDDPPLTLLTLLGLGSASFWIHGLWSRRARAPGSQDSLDDDHPAHLRGSVLLSCLMAWAAWLAVAAEQATDHPGGRISALLAFIIAGFHAARWAFRTAKRETGLRRLRFLLPLVGTIGAVASWTSPTTAFTFLALQQLLILLLLISVWRTSLDWWQPIAEHPARLLAGTFAALGLLGGLVLSFPVCSTIPGGASLMDGIFTAVSASCVTGLTVLDTPRDFTPFGQLVILFLIQVGGLGIMTFSAGFALAIGKRLGIRQEMAVAELVSGEVGGALRKALFRILIITASFEAGGALLLSLRFWSIGDSPGMAVWRGLFTSVSAFCNAGFALQSDNLVPYQQDVIVLNVVATLILFGGFGAGVIAVLPSVLRRRDGLLDARLVLLTSAALLVLATGLIAGFEWNYSLKDLPLGHRLDNAWFQAVTPRTAGFNSLDYAQLQPPTLILTMFLMFVGGSPGSTAGGIKTTTLAILALTTLSALRGQETLRTFGRTVSRRSVQRATAVLILGLGFVFIGVTAITLTQEINFLGALFEVFSAMGTVGLSMGVTTRLDTVGKIIITFLMYAGRIGPLTLFLLFQESRLKDSWQYPEEQVAVG